MYSNLAESGSTIFAAIRDVRFSFVPIYQKLCFLQAFFCLSMCFIVFICELITSICLKSLFRPQQRYICVSLCH